MRSDEFVPPSAAEIAERVGQATVRVQLVLFFFASLLAVMLGLALFEQRWLPEFVRIVGFVALIACGMWLPIWLAAKIMAPILEASRPGIKDISQ